jgi:hypothetical protein
MRNYIIEVPELHYSKHSVTAKSLKVAIKKIKDGKSKESNSTFDRTFDTDEKDWLLVKETEVKKMNPSEVREKLKSVTGIVSFTKGIYTAKKSYYWGITKSGSEFADKVKAALPEAEILEHGNHYHAFCGGAKSGSAKDSYYWVTFKMKE